MTVAANVRHALQAVLELARSDESDPISVHSVAHRHHIPEAALAKVFQRLVHSGLVVGMRGPHGGYRLARPASEITVLDVMNAFAPAPAPGSEAPQTIDGDESLQEFFETVDGQMRSAFASVTIDRLALRENPSL